MFEKKEIFKNETDNFKQILFCTQTRLPLINNKILNEQPATKLEMNDSENDETPVIFKFNDYTPLI